VGCVGGGFIMLTMTDSEQRAGSLRGTDWENQGAVYEPAEHPFQGELPDFSPSREPRADPCPASPRQLTHGVGRSRRRMCRTDERQERRVVRGGATRCVIERSK